MPLILLLLSAVFLMILGAHAQSDPAPVESTPAEAPAGATAGEISIPLVVNDQNYEFILPDNNEQSIVDLADRFCTEMSESLSLTAETKNDKCLIPLANELFARSRPQEIVVPLTINGATYDFTMVDVEENTIIRLSEQFCEQASESLGLTAETKRAECVEPVATELYRRTRPQPPAQEQEQAPADAQP